MSAGFTPYAKKDGSALPATFYIGLMGGKNSAGEAEALEIMGDGALKTFITNGGLSAGGVLYSNATGDFTATVKTDTSNIITVNGLGAFTLEAKHVVGGIIMVKDNTSNIWQSVDLTTISVSGDDIICGEISDTTSGWVTTDEVLVVLVGPPRAYDKDLDADLNIIQNPSWSRYTPAEDLISSPLVFNDTGWNDVGEIAMQGYNRLGLWLGLTFTTSTYIQIRILYRYESGGTEDFSEIYLGAPSGGITTINENIYKIVSANGPAVFKLDIPVDATTPYVQVQAKTDVGNGTVQIDAAYITKAYSA